MTYPGHTPYAPWLLEQGLPHNAWDLVVVREPVGRLAEQWARLEEEWAKRRRFSGLALGGSVCGEVVG